MINRLSRYLSSLFFIRFLMTAFAMIALMSVLDALSNADLLPKNAGMSGNLRYMVLRMPVLFDRILPFALLLSVMLTYLSLIRRNELVPVWGAGLSVFGQFLALAPAAALAGLISAAIIDQAVPPAQNTLEKWLGPEILRPDDNSPKTLWLAEKNMIIEITGANRDVLHGLTFFERDDDNRITSVTRATSAVKSNGGWVLLGTSQIRYDGKPPEPPKNWNSSFGPNTLRHLLAEPRQLSALTLAKLAKLRRSGNRPSSAYLVWLYNRTALPVVAIGFLLLAMSLMQRFGRNDRAELTLVIGMIIGFIYMVTDGISKSLAESGVMLAFIATSVPVLGLFAVGVALAFYRTIRT